MIFVEALIAISPLLIGVASGVPFRLDR